MLRRIRWPPRLRAVRFGGRGSVLLLGLLISITSGGALWQWERSQHLPLPPQAHHVDEVLMPLVSRQTTFRVPAPVEDIRSFYQRTLPARGWRYCGTQATPNCTNLPGFGAKPEIDVYRRVADRNGTGVTIELWPLWDPVHHETFVKVFETTFRDTPPPLNPGRR